MQRENKAFSTSPKVTARDNYVRAVKDGDCNARGYRIDSFDRIARWGNNTVDTNYVTSGVYVDFLWKFQFLAEYWLLTKSLYNAYTM